METEVKLSKRLTGITQYVTPGSIVADIGCDHGFVSIYLIQKGIAKSVIASDINEGPLERAKEHAKQYQLADCIQLRLSDGMNALSKEDQVDCAIIAGMGGRMMIHIITQALERDLCLPQLILQPQSEWQQLRFFLRQVGYEIQMENMILEDGKYYPILKVSYQGKGEVKEIVGIERELADLFGPVLLAQKHSVLKQYLEKELVKFTPIFASLPDNHKSYEEMKEKLQRLKQALALMEG